MKCAFLPYIVLIAVSACSLGGASAKPDIRACWKYVSNVSGHTKVKNVEFIYLRGETVVIPSLICQNLRMQGVDFSSSALHEVKTLERRDVSVPLGVRGSILMDILNQPSPNVIEIRVVKILSSTKLTQARSLLLMDRMRVK